VSWRGQAGDGGSDGLGVVAGEASPIGLTVEAVDVPPDWQLGLRECRAALRPYASPDWRSAFQLAGNMTIFTSAWWLASVAFRVHSLLALLPVVPLSVAVLRSFIVFHDCGHGSFSRSRMLNDVVGSLLGIVVFTPFRYWSYAHAIHHATASDLDRRGVGDVWTFTLDEYSQASRWRRFYYRAYHSPWVLFTLGPIIKFGIVERLVTRPDTTPKRVVRSVYFTNFGIVVYAAVMCWLVGVHCFLLVQGAALVLAGSAAIWLFYVQHRFEGAHWCRRSDWKFLEAGLLGSSYVKLGPVLRYVSGNIGYHHLHHLEARIPNYKLARCSREHPELSPRRTLTLRDILGCRHTKLWDEAAGCWVTFAGAETARRRSR